MKLTKISNQFEIFLSNQKDENKNKAILLKNSRVFYRFMNRLYIPEHVYKLSPAFVKELNNLRDKYALSIIDKEYNDLIIDNALDYLKARFSNSLRVLDFGCGNGYASSFIKRKFSDSLLFGYDVRKPLEKKLLETYTDVAFKTVDSKLPYSNEFFDVILAFFVFHFYVSDLQLRELTRILKPSGILFINLINSADFDILNRINNVGFSIVEEVVFSTTNNTGRGYFYCLKNGQK